MSHADVLSIFSGALTTLLLSIAGIALGLPLGLGLALARDIAGLLWDRAA